MTEPTTAASDVTPDSQSRSFGGADVTTSVTTGQKVRDLLKTWLVLIVVGSLPGLVIVGIALGVRGVV